MIGWKVCLDGSDVVLYDTRQWKAVVCLLLLQIQGLHQKRRHFNCAAMHLSRYLAPHTPKGRGASHREERKRRERYRWVLSCILLLLLLLLLLVLLVSHTYIFHVQNIQNIDRLLFTF